MAAYQLPLTAHVGEYWSYTFAVDQPATWTGWTGRAQIRYYRGGVLLVELTTELTVAGQVTVSMPALGTALLTPLVGEWDLYVKPAVGDPQYIVEGPVHITGRVTVPA